MNFHLNIVSSENFVCSELINKIQVSGDKGQLGIYPGHLQLLSFLKPGIICYINNDNRKKYIYLSGGIIEIQPDVVNIITKIAIRIKKLDESSIVQEEHNIKNAIKNSFIINKSQLLTELCNEFRNIREKLIRISA
ncbi:hypothetical protein XW81_00050 [Buchnera aphidicola (Schlechtendalia chinensis)]|uniref:ATP synthase epsilon chain n=1 Tax=Buchnera aphidicola subsp. Schlechtendalia chinensis TaxID=118110 RepID=A0A172WCZ5_BUCSC|nr:ATP synthase F1 subunit epsilon [Buchnera aphidicola]ANF16836.1 hypothetical protein XW81_00050 [Buchnera aphidicola (Schlechtendalia chinensis)]